MPAASDRPHVSPLDRQRRLVCDVVAAAQRVPAFPVERLMDLQAVAEARAAAVPRIGWAALFIKGYALVARDMPPLRSWYLPGLQPRQATSPESVATLSINRRVDDRDVLFWAHLPAPDRMPLAELQASIDRHARDPIDTVFRRQLQLAALPGWLRRAVLWWNLHTASRKRAKRMGTFSLSTLAGQAAYNRLHPSPLTTSLTYGPLDAEQRCLVTLLADHRLLDGVPVARALESLERVLGDEIACELRSMQRDASERTAA